MKRGIESNAASLSSNEGASGKGPAATTEAMESLSLFYNEMISDVCCFICTEKVRGLEIVS